MNFEPAPAMPAQPRPAPRRVPTRINDKPFTPIPIPAPETVGIVAPVVIPSPDDVGVRLK